VNDSSVAAQDAVDQYLNKLSGVRRARLSQLVEQRACGNASKFAEMTGFARAQIAQFLSPTYSAGRSIGERAARTLEHRACLPFGWLDQEDT
jgi:hypothetical protein